jgi:hypothetical protein
MNSEQRQKIKILLAKSSPKKLNSCDNELATLNAYSELESDKIDKLLNSKDNIITADNSQRDSHFEETNFEKNRNFEKWLNIARSNLNDNGIECKTLRLNDFFTKQEIDVLKKRIDDEINYYPVSEPWRCWDDYIIVCIAGMLSGLWELFVKKLNILELGIPDEELKKVRVHREKFFKDKGTAYLKKYFGTEIDGKWVLLDANGNIMKNPMTRHVMDARIPKEMLGNFGTDMHRGVGPMHDVCRIRKTVEMMMSNDPDFYAGGKSAKELMQGPLRMIGVKGPEATKFNVFGDPKAAFVAILFHLLSDFVTSRSLPLPGMTWIADTGPEWRDKVMYLYSNGLNLKNVIGGAAHLSSPIITEGILRIYFATTYTEGSISLKNFLSQGLKLNTVREREMLIVAHAIATAVGSLKFVISQNVIDLNAVAILGMLKHSISLHHQIRKIEKENLKKTILATERLKKEIDDQYSICTKPVQYLDEDNIVEALNLKGKGPISINL